MYRFGEEDNELREQYNFGSLESATTRNVPADASASDVHVNVPEPSASLEDFSPREEAHFDPTSPQAFGPTDETDLPPRSQFTNAVPANGNQTKGKHDGKKMGVLKEVFGANKKSTKGKSDEEKQQIMLEQRWKNALKEEERLTEMECQVASGEVRNEELERKPNFPRKFLCIRPLVYHDINSVPAERQRFVKMAFWDWVAVCILLLANTAVAIGVPYAPMRNDAKPETGINKALNIVLAIVYLVGIPLSFILWYWRIYCACSSGRPGQHIVALSGLIIALAQEIFMIIGPKSYGAAGIILAIWVGNTRAKGIVAPVVIMIFLWLAQAGLTCYFIFKQFIYYRADLNARRAAKRHAAPVLG